MVARIIRIFQSQLLAFVFVLSASVCVTAQSIYVTEIQRVAQSDLKGAISFADSLLQVGVEPKEDILHLLGVMNLDLHYPEVALFYFKQEKDLYRFRSDKEKIADVLVRMAEANVYLSKKTEAVSLLREGLSIVQELKNKKLEARIYLTFGLMSSKLKDREKVLSYLLQAKNIQETIRDTLGFSETYNDLGIVYGQIGMPDSGIWYLKKSLEINESRGDFLPVSVNYANLIGIYQQLGNDKEIVRSYQKTIEIQSELDILDPRTCLDFAIYLIHTGKKGQATKYRKMARQLVDKTPRINVLTTVYKQLFELALQDRNFDEAEYYHEKSDSIAELKQDVVIKEKLALVNKQYQLEKNESILERKLAINRRNKMLFGSLSLLLLFFGLFLIQQNRNTKLAGQKERVILEQKVLSSQMNPHFIYNTLSAVQSSILKKDPLASADSLAVFAKLIRQNFELVAKEKVTLEEDLDALKNYIKTQQFRFNYRFDYEIIIAEDIDTQRVEVPPLLLQPFVENAIEHGLKELKTPGFLKISIFKKGKRICFRVVDNGVGLKESNTKDRKLHAMDIFRQRLTLIHEDDVDSFSLSDKTGETIAKYCLTL